MLSRSNRFAPLLFVLALPFLLACICSGLTGPTRQDYVAANGECFVPPQGDPVYDHFYANEINPPNCGAFEQQSEAFVNEAEALRIEADARRIQEEALNTRVGTVIEAGGASLTMLIFVGVLLLVGYGITH